MTNPIFEAIAVVIAILLAAAAFILAAAADWFAAWSEGLLKNLLVAYDSSEASG